MPGASTDMVLLLQVAGSKRPSLQLNHTANSSDCGTVSIVNKLQTAIYIPQSLINSGCISNMCIMDIIVFIES